jgi:hypothetical protein
MLPIHQALGWVQYVCFLFRAHSLKLQVSVLSSITLCDAGLSENAPRRVYLSRAIIIIYECKKMKIPAHTANHYGPINHPLSTPLASTGAAGSSCRINANSTFCAAPKGRPVYALYKRHTTINVLKKVQKWHYPVLKASCSAVGEFLIENSGKVNSYYRKTDSPEAVRPSRHNFR